jgi:hypothetical protein
MAMHNAAADDERIRKRYHCLHLQWSWRYSGWMLNGGDNTTIILRVDFMVQEVDGIVPVRLVKSSFSPVDLG